MIGLAYRAFLSRPSARSVFYTCKKLPLVLEVRKTRLLRQEKSTKKEEKDEVIFIKRQLRMTEFNRDRARSPIPGALLLTAEMVPVQLYGMGKLEHTPKQLLLRWIGGKGICLPTDCSVCGVKGTQAHWSRCHNLGDTTLDIFEGNYARAAEIIGRVVQLYHDRKAPTAGTP